MGFLDPNFASTLLLLVFMVFSSFTVDNSSAQALIPQDEVDTLKTISTKLKADVYFNNVTQYSCIEETGMNTTVNGLASNVTCECNTTVCHVVTIELQSLNLTGVFPEEFGNLTKLREIDLTRNYINGTLPTSLSKIPLVTLAILGNRISGSIPSAFGDISTLEELNIEDNLLEGTLPDSLGNLKNLRRILLSANNITGTIPESYGNLKNLTDFRIDGNSLSGAIPEFIGNWTNITVLNMQGTNMSGPIPSTISALVNLQELRISDLNGPSSNSFPNLTSTSFQLLVLRNCSLTGTIPDSIGNSSSAMKTLDLSFNKLTGEIPDKLQQLTGMNFMFLTNNSLTGSVPDWIRSTKQKFDLSYNNFTGSIDAGCDATTLNLLAAFSIEASKNESSGILWCMTEDLTCPGDANQHSLYINAGGLETEFEGNTYAHNINADGESAFIVESNSWAYSSTGTFMNNDGASFIASNKFNLNVSDVYTSARTAPISLKYYGLCMMKGSYTVKLHFAEIMYSDDETFSSLGKRIFDVSVQGRIIESNFNIAERAGGVGIPFVLELPDVQVNGTTLEISMYWAGKGTTAIPARGVYGPLISAITVTPNFKVGTGLSAGAIAGIVVACVVALVLILVALRLMGYLGGKDKENEELRGILQTGYFSLKQIKAATDNFNAANKIGEGGFGPVYKGVLSDGKVIAVKQLSAKSRQGNREFVNEIGMISALQHSNLVKLYGCCIEGNQLLLVYEYLENNSLARALFGRDDQRLNLDWTTRKKICLGIAKGLAYLHEESRLKIIHRDIKATNVLLDKDLNAKISDFGLAKLDEDEDTHISTRIAGTIGYMAPEYAMRGYLTDKADVYSFGIVALEIVSGKSNTNYRPKDEFVYLLDWAYVLQEQGNLLDLVDPVLGTRYNSEEAMRMLTIGLLCSNPSPTLRPSMSSVVQMLQGKIKVQAPIIMRNHYTEAEEMRFKAFEKLSQDSLTHVSSVSVESQEQKTMPMSGPMIDSSSRKLLDN